MIDIRQHVYSLAAVFLALAIGIMIGTSFAKSHPSGAAGRNTIARYEQDMKTLRTEIVKAAESAHEKDATIKACQDYCRAVMPSVITNKLYWRNVAIIQTGDSDDLTGSVKRALEMAGATVVCTMDISREFPFGDDKSISKAMEDSGLGSTYDPSNDKGRLFRLLALAASSGRHSHLVSKLENAGAAKFIGSFGKSCGMVVLTGGADDPANDIAQNVDSQLVPELEKLGVTVVGCESSGAKTSYVPIWHKCGIATVDDADSAMGQTCLIYALNGENANFGTKETADRLIPKALETP